jgi:rhodanese-related sulfurtransferase
LRWQKPAADWARKRRPRTWGFRGGYRIITTEELADGTRRDPSATLLVDTRQEWEYRAGHIRGAVNFPIESTGWSRWRKADGLGKLLGPDRDRNIVFY